MSEALDAAFGSANERTTQRLLDAERQCLRCGVLYCERTNIGSWSCRAYHPGAAFVTAHQRTVPCCGRARESRGCVAADHSDYYESDDWETVSATVAQAVRSAQARSNVAPLPARRGITVWRYNAHEQHYSVLRFDRDAYADVLARTLAPPLYDARHNDGFAPSQLYA